MKQKKVAIGLSGGVDSAVAAYLLKEQGFEVTGVFLECYYVPGCRAEQDHQDALQIALDLNIKFKVLDFKKAYQNKILNYFFSEYQSGRTPNPDVLCNKEIKFGLFYDWVLQNNFDYLATGHYAKIKDNNLLIPKDKAKDQTYFLYQLKQEQLNKILFPLQDLTKKQVRAIAKKQNFKNANKADSTGICFIGEINIKKFLKENLGENLGDIINSQGQVLGQHQGLWFYTIGQRHGFQVKNKTPHSPASYVIGKNKIKNQLIIGPREMAMQKNFEVSNLHWIDPRKGRILCDPLFVRIRNTGKLFKCRLTSPTDKKYKIKLKNKIFAPAEGQAAVFYQDNICLGGGIICEVLN